MAVIAGRQQGNVSYAQLRRCGLNDNAIRHRVRTGRLFRVYPGVYSVGKPPVTPLERASAAILACGPTGTLSHASAMTLWGYFRHWETPFEVTVTRDRRPKGIKVHRSRTLAHRDITEQHGIRTTTPARTLFDMAPRLRQRTLTRKVNDALVSPYMAEQSLAELLIRHPNAKATHLLAPFVNLDGGPTRSVLEDHWRRFDARFNFPHHVMNVLVNGYLADVWFPNHNLIVELDSHHYHGTRISFEADRDRDADTLEAGIATVRITDHRMTHTPVKEADRLHRIIEQRALTAARYAVSSS